MQAVSLVWPGGNPKGGSLAFHRDGDRHFDASILTARSQEDRMLAAMDSDDDGHLMSQYRNGDLKAFESLYARHKGPLYRYLLRYVRNAAVAADLFQEVWSRIIASRGRYEARAKFATYLFHIAHNCAIDHHRRGIVAIHGQGDDDPSPLAELAGPEHQRPDRIAEHDEQRTALLAALSDLPDEQREVFLLREETGLGIDEIARVTGVPAETAKSRLRYAVRKLRDALTESARPGVGSEAAKFRTSRAAPAQPAARAIQRVR
jgi:RNA polymerase sigma-70 factor (ECF subfamily)